MLLCIADPLSQLMRLHWNAFSMTRFIRRTSHHFWTCGIQEGKGIKVMNMKGTETKGHENKRKYTSLHKKMSWKVGPLYLTIPCIMHYFGEEAHFIIVKFRLENHQDLNKALSGARWVPDKRCQYLQVSQLFGAKHQETINWSFLVPLLGGR